PLAKRATGARRTRDLPATVLIKKSRIAYAWQVPCSSGALHAATAVAIRQLIEHVATGSTLSCGSNDIPCAFRSGVLSCGDRRTRVAFAIRDWRTRAASAGCSAPARRSEAGPASRGSRARLHVERSGGSPSEPGVARRSKGPDARVLSFRRLVTVLQD